MPEFLVKILTTRLSYLTLCAVLWKVLDQLDQAITVGRWMGNVWSFFLTDEGTLVFLALGIALLILIGYWPRIRTKFFNWWVFKSPVDRFAELESSIEEVREEAKELVESVSSNLISHRGSLGHSIESLHKRIVPQPVDTGGHLTENIQITPKEVIWNRVVNDEPLLIIRLKVRNFNVFDVILVSVSEDIFVNGNECFNAKVRRTRLDSHSKEPTVVDIYQPISTKTANKLLEMSTSKETASVELKATKFEFERPDNSVLFEQFHMLISHQFRETVQLS